VRRFALATITLALLWTGGTLTRPAQAARPRPRPAHHQPPPKVEEAEDEGEGEDTDEKGDDEEGNERGEAAKPRPKAVAAHDVAPLVRDTFADAHFTFCHDRTYPLTDDELRWCSLMVKSDPRCPALADACLRGPAARQEGKREPEKPTSFTMPELPAIGRLMLWILLGAAVALLVGYLARHAIRQRRPPTADEVAPEPEAGTAAAAPPNVVETDVARLLEQARVAAAAGDFGPGNELS
jgi:hypothetical protein